MKKLTADEKWEDTLKHMHNVDMLNLKGKNEYIKILVCKISELNCKILDLENGLQEEKLKNERQKKIG